MHPQRLLPHSCCRWLSQSCSCISFVSVFSFRGETEAAWQILNTISQFLILMNEIA